MTTVAVELAERSTTVGRLGGADQPAGRGRPHRGVLRGRGPGRGAARAGRRSGAWTPSAVRVDGALVGFGQLRVSYGLVEGRVTRRLGGGVHPDYRGRGSGTAAHGPAGGPGPAAGRPSGTRAGEVLLRASGGIEGASVRPMLEHRGYADRPLLPRDGPAICPDRCPTPELPVRPLHGRAGRGAPCWPTTTRSAPTGVRRRVTSRAVAGHVWPRGPSGRSSASSAWPTTGRCRPS